MDHDPTQQPDVSFLTIVANRGTNDTLIRLNSVPHFAAQTAPFETLVEDAAQIFVEETDLVDKLVAIAHRVYICLGAVDSFIAEGPFEVPLYGAWVVLIENWRLQATIKHKLEGLQAPTVVAHTSDRRKLRHLLQSQNGQIVFGRPFEVDVCVCVAKMPMIVQSDLDRFDIRARTTRFVNRKGLLQLSLPLAQLSHFLIVESINDQLSLLESQNFSREISFELF